MKDNRFDLGRFLRLLRHDVARLLSWKWYVWVYVVVMCPLLVWVLSRINPGVSMATPAGRALFYAFGGSYFAVTATRTAYADLRTVARLLMPVSALERTLSMTLVGGLLALALVALLWAVDTLAVTLPVGLFTSPVFADDGIGMLCADMLPGVALMGLMGPLSVALPQSRPWMNRLLILLPVVVVPLLWLLVYSRAVKVAIVVALIVAAVVAVHQRLKVITLGQMIKA